MNFSLNTNWYQILYFHKDYEAGKHWTLEVREQKDIQK